MVKPRTGQYRDCQTCGEEFYVPKSLLERAKYCSKPCQNLGRVTQISRNCEKCYEVFVVNQKSLRKYCSNECASNKPNKVDAECQQCFKAFFGAPDRKFCSKECFTSYQTEWAIGSITLEGYRVVSVKGKSVKEHRYVMEQYLGRPLRPEETVHHINGVRQDNRLENLELWSSSHPKGQRVEDKLKWAREMIELYT